MLADLSSYTYPLFSRDLAVAVLVEDFEEEEHALVLRERVRRVQVAHQLDADRHDLARLERVRTILVDRVERRHARHDELWDRGQIVLPG